MSVETPVNVRFINRTEMDLRSFLFELDLPCPDPERETVIFELIPIRFNGPIQTYSDLCCTILVLPANEWEYSDEPLFYHFKVGVFAASQMFKFVEDLSVFGKIAEPQFFL